MSSIIYLNRNLFFERLKENGTSLLIHANTLPTASSFLKMRHLLSRQFCETHSLPMTSQFTDPTDKSEGVWNMIFLNLRDSHEQFGKFNSFGPIHFYVSAEKLNFHLKETAGQIAICKVNVENWNSKLEGDRWFNDVPKFDDIWHIRRDIVIATPSGSIPLAVVDKIVVDRHPHDCDWQARAMETLKSRANDSIDIVPHTCDGANCTCNYRGNLEWLIQSRYQTTG